MIQRHSRFFSNRSHFSRAMARLILALSAATLLLQNDARSAESFSGYPVPRFVTLGAIEVNVRAGPSKLHPIKWQYVRLGLPVKVFAETEEWRRIRDSHGNEGWVFHTLLDGRRSILVTGDGTGRPVALREQPAGEALIVAVAEPGALIRLEECQKAWCKLTAPEAQGWARRSLLWGVLETEGVD